VGRFRKGEACAHFVNITNENIDGLEKAISCLNFATEAFANRSRMCRFRTGETPAYLINVADKNIDSLEKAVSCLNFAAEATGAQKRWRNVIAMVWVGRSLQQPFSEGFRFGTQCCDRVLSDPGDR
jgi:hypothetical protein